MPSLISRRSKFGASRRKSQYSPVAAEAHHPFNRGAVVPAAIKHHDLASGRQMRDIALEIPLRQFAIGGLAQRDQANIARLQRRHDAFNRAALASGVAPIER